MDPAERAALHARLDELLDRRERIEAHTVGSYARGVYPTPPLGRVADHNPRDAYAACLAFARDVGGPLLPWLAFDPFPEYPPNVARLLALRDRLSLARPLLEPSGEPPVVPGPSEAGWDSAVTLGASTRLDLAAIGAELFALAQGDTSDLFAPAPRDPGQQAKRHQLARARLRALELDQFRKGENARRPKGERERPGAWRPAILNAFGESEWDTVRKWKGLCLRDLGGPTVGLLLAAAEMGLPEWERGPRWEQLTERGGQHLKDLERASAGAERAKRKPRTARARTI